MYRLSLDNYRYYYRTLEETCNRFYEYLKVFSLEKHALEGRFEKTFMATNNIKKIKKYILDINSTPQLHLEIFKMEKEPLAPELVYYYLKSKMETLECKA